MKITNIELKNWIFHRIQELINLYFQRAKFEVDKNRFMQLVWMMNYDDQNRFKTCLGWCDWGNRFLAPTKSWKFYFSDMNEELCLQLVKSGSYVSLATFIWCALVLHLTK